MTYKNPFKIFTSFTLLCVMLFRISTPASIFAGSTKRTTGILYPHHFDKSVDRKNVSEDSFFVSQVSLVISDGAGAYPFPSIHMANMIVNATTQGIINGRLNEAGEIDTTKTYDNKSITEIISENLYKAIDSYNNNINTTCDALFNLENVNTDEFQDFMEKLQSFTILPSHEKNKFFGAAGTLLGAYLVNLNKKTPDLRIFQIGDSLAMLLEPVFLTEEGTERYYTPVFITDNQREWIHTTAQISNLEIDNIVDILENQHYNSDLTEDMKKYVFKHYLEKKIKEFQVPISSADTLILGSDGLFDNVSPVVLTLFYNYTMKVIEEKIESGEEVSPEHILDELVNEFIYFAKANQDEYFENLRQELKEPDHTKHISSRLNDEFYLNVLQNYNNIKLRNFNSGSILAIPREPQEERVIQNEDTLTFREKKIEVKNEKESLPIEPLPIEPLPIKPLTIETLPIEPLPIEPFFSDIASELENKIEIDNQIPNQQTGSLNDMHQNRANNSAFHNEVRQMTNFIRSSGCPLKDFMQYPTSFDIEGNLNTVQVSDCIKNLLKQFVVKNNYLRVAGYNTMTKALARAAYRISKEEGLHASPFSVGLYQFKINKEGVKEDDITVIVSSIEEKNLEGQPGFIDKTPAILQSAFVDIQNFLVNTFKVKKTYYRN